MLLGCGSGEVVEAQGGESSTTEGSMDTGGTSGGASTTATSTSDTTASATAAWASASLVTSVRRNSARSVALLAFSSPASFSPRSALRSAITTLPPASCRARAVASPSPEAPPVTMKVLSWNFMAILRNS